MTVKKASERRWLPGETAVVRRTTGGVIWVQAVVVIEDDGDLYFDAVEPGGTWKSYRTDEHGLDVGAYDYLANADGSPWVR